MTPESETDEGLSEFHAELRKNLQHLSNREGLDTARNVRVASLADKLLEPAEMDEKQQLRDSNLSDLIREKNQRPEKVGPVNYLAMTEGPVTEDEAFNFPIQLQAEYIKKHKLSYRIFNHHREDGLKCT